MSSEWTNAELAQEYGLENPVMPYLRQDRLPHIWRRELLRPHSEMRFQILCASTCRVPRQSTKIPCAAR